MYAHGRIRPAWGFYADFGALRCQEASQSSSLPAPGLRASGTKTAQILHYSAFCLKGTAHSACLRSWCICSLATAGPCIPQEASVCVSTGGEGLLASKFTRGASREAEIVVDWTDPPDRPIGTEVPDIRGTVLPPTLSIESDVAQCVGLHKHK